MGVILYLHLSQTPPLRFKSDTLDKWPKDKLFVTGILLIVSLCYISGTTKWVKLLGSLNPYPLSVLASYRALAVPTSVGVFQSEHESLQPGQNHFSTIIHPDRMVWAWNRLTFHPIRRSEGKNRIWHLKVPENQLWRISYQSHFSIIVPTASVMGWGALTSIYKMLGTSKHIDLDLLATAMQMTKQCNV